MPKPLTSHWTRQSGFSCSYHAAGCRTLTLPPSGLYCRRLSRQVALPMVNTARLLREKCQPSSGQNMSFQADSGLSR